MNKKKNHSITVSDVAWHTIQDLAKEKGHSTSQELEMLILNQKQNENAIKTIFQEISDIKKKLLEREHSENVDQI